MSAVSSLSEGFQQADHDQTKRGGSVVRNIDVERVELAQNMAVVSSEERRHVIAGDDFSCDTKAPWEDHQNRSVVENAAGEHMPIVDRAVENVQEEQRPSLVVADDNRFHAVFIDCGHGAVIELAGEASRPIHQAGGDAADIHDTALLQQPSTARSKTSEYISYRDDFTEMSDNHATCSATDSRLACLLPLLLKEL